MAERVVTVGESEALLMIERLPLMPPAPAGLNVTLKLAPWPAARVMGIEDPETLKPDPVVEACVMVTLAEPEFVTNTGKMLLLPTVTFPKLRLAGLVVSLPVAATPLPDRGTVSGEFEPAAQIDKLPLDAVAAPGIFIGAYMTISVMAWPAESERGNCSGMSVNPVPEIAIFEIVRADAPPLDSLSGRELVEPNATLPKLRLDGESISWAASPPALSETVSGEFDALLVTEMLPELLPAPGGVNFALKLVFAPGASVMGRARLLMLKPGPVTLAPETFTALWPVLLSVITCVALDPGATVPKETRAGDAAS